MKRACLLLFLLPFGKLLAQSGCGSRQINAGSVTTSAYTCGYPSASFSQTGSVTFTCVSSAGPTGCNSYPAASASGSGVCGLGAMGFTDCPPKFTVNTNQTTVSGTITATNSVMILGLCSTLLQSSSTSLPAQCPTAECCAPNNNPPNCCGGFTGGCSMAPVWSYCNCQWSCQNVSPILINIDGLGWNLTDAANGVMFDFFGNGQAIQMAWTAALSNNAFLCLDRQQNGAIDGPDLFGNVTPQPPCAPDQCNGFAALAVFDQPADGGNGNGRIDPADAIWPSL